MDVGRHERIHEIFIRILWYLKPKCAFQVPTIPSNRMSLRIIAKSHCYQRNQWHPYLAGRFPLFIRIWDEKPRRPLLGWLRDGSYTVLESVKQRLNDEIIPKCLFGCILVPSSPAMQRIHQSQRFNTTALMWIHLTSIVLLRDTLLIYSFFSMKIRNLNTTNADIWTIATNINLTVTPFQILRLYIIGVAAVWRVCLLTSDDYS